MGGIVGIVGMLRHDPLVPGKASNFFVFYYGVCGYAAIISMIPRIPPISRPPGTMPGRERRIEARATGPFPAAPRNLRVPRERWLPADMP